MSPADLSEDAIHYLTLIGVLDDKIQNDERQKVRYIHLARAHGASWRMLGAALGTSGQAAWERYRPAEAPRPKPGQGALPLDTDDQGHRPGSGNHSTVAEYKACKYCYPGSLQGRNAQLAHDSNPER